MPYCVNDLSMQQLLQDRRCVLKLLDVMQVKTPRRFISDTGEQALISNQVIQRVKNEYKIDLSPQGFKKNLVRQLEEDSDCIEQNGQFMFKPFVEKPLSGENHNIYIYFPKSVGGGARKLFRKVLIGSSNSNFYSILFFHFSIQIGNKSSEFDETLTFVIKIQLIQEENLIS